MKVYQKLIGLILFIAIFCISNNAQAQLVSGVSWAEASAAKKGEITIIYYPEAAFAYSDRQGRPTGVELDILTQFVTWIKNAKGVELQINWVLESNFEKLYNDVKKGVGGVFGAANITITEERKSELRFSPPYLNNIAVLVTHTSVPDLKQMDQIGTAFKGFTAVVHKATTHTITLNEIKSKYFPSLKITYVNSDVESLTKVESDPSYFTYTDLSNYWLAQKNKMAIKRHPVGDQTSEQFGFIMPISSDWGPLMDEFFNLGTGYRSNITYKKILMRHLGTEVTKMLEMAQSHNK